LKPAATSIGRHFLAAAVILGLAVGAVVLAITQLRNDAHQDAFEETGNLATVLAGQMSRFLQSIDILLIETKKSVEALDPDLPDWQGAVTGPHMHELLKERRSRLPGAVNLVIANNNGQVITTSAAYPPPDINVSDRDYFQAARDRTDGNLTISAPLVSRVDGQKTIIFARALKAPDGAFVGVVYLSVNVTYFEVIYNSIESVRNLVFTLARLDGTILVRHPLPDDRAGQSMPASSRWYETAAKGGGSFYSRGNLDNRPRLVSVRRVDPYPLGVSVSIVEAAALERWRIRSIVLALGCLAFLACAIYLLRAVRGKVEFLRRSESALRHQSEAFERSNMLLEAALNNMSQGLCMFDAEQRVVVANSRFGEIYGLAPAQLKRGTSKQDLVAYLAANRGHNDPAFEECLKLDVSDAATIQLLDDGRFISILRQRMRDGGWVTTHEDVTDRQQDQARIAFMAHHDALTGLGNRASFMEKVQEASARLRRRGEAFSVFMLDLDRFKYVNDTFGHPAGDLLLRETAQRLKSSLRETDVLARLGGDEFAIIQVSGEGQHESASALADKLIDLITEPYEIEGKKVIVGTSIGIALAPYDATEASDLLKKADVALYHAKSEGRNAYSFFSAEMLAAAQERHLIENELRGAIQRREFELHYQPVIDVRTRACRGVEALVRWRHPERGLLPPDQFIPIAEDTGLIIPLGEWIVQQACADAAALPAGVKVAINLSPTQLAKGNLFEVILCGLVESGLTPDRLELEITETALLKRDADYLSFMRRLKNLGASIALDDFGTGYSSLSYLTIFPFDTIKIDKSFTQNLTKRAECRAIISAVLALGSGLSIKTVAEGVETEEQFQLLRAAGVDFVQGYLFGRPRPMAELELDGVALERAPKALSA
jgi:diguanylate cyclase (GGDEF)-like protein